MQNKPNWDDRLRPAAAKPCSRGDAEAQRKARLNPSGPLRPGVSARGIKCEVENKPNLPGGPDPAGRGEWGECAKQTQFPTGEIPQRSTVLSFHHSRRMPFVQNEAKLGQDETSGGWCLRETNRAKQSQFPPEHQEGQVLCRKGIMVNHTCKRLRQNKANSGRSPVGRGQRDVGRGTKAPNEPNLVWAPRKGRGWPPDPAGARRRQTKPISAGAAGGASGLQERSYGERHVQQASAKQSQFAGTTPDGRGTGESAAEPALRRIAPNKPNSSIADWDSPVAGRPARPLSPGAACTKRSQFGDGRAASGERNAQNEPNWAQRIVRNEPNSVGSNLQNEPNSRRPGYPPFQHSTIPGFQSDACCAKRTQLPEAGHRGGVRRGRVGRGMLYKQTQFLPLCRSGDRRPGRARPHPTRGAIAPNKPNSAPRRADRVPGRRKCAKRSHLVPPPLCNRWNGTKQSQFRKVRAGVGRQMCKTNPILARRAEPMDLESTTVCRPHPLRSLRALCGCDRAATAIECDKQCRGRRWIRWSAIARRK